MMNLRLSMCHTPAAIANTLYGTGVNAAMRIAQTPYRSKSLST